LSPPLCNFPCCFWMSSPRTINHRLPRMELVDGTPRDNYCSEIYVSLSTHSLVFCLALYHRVLVFLRAHHCVYLTFCQCSQLEYFPQQFLLPLHQQFQNALHCCSRCRGLSSTCGYHKMVGNPKGALVLGDNVCFSMLWSGFEGA